MEVKNIEDAYSRCPGIKNITKDSTQVLIVPDITGFSTNDLVSGTGGASPSGSATIASIENPLSQGDYDMELYIGYQTLDLII